MSSNLVVFVPSHVSENQLVDWIRQCPEVHYQEGEGMSLNSGGSLFIYEASDIEELAVSYEGSSRAILDHCLVGRRAWYVTYRRTAGSIRHVVAHLAKRWPLYVDTDFWEVLTGAAFVDRLCHDPDWDLANSDSNRDSLSANFRF